MLCIGWRKGKCLNISRYMIELKRNEKMKNAYYIFGAYGDNHIRTGHYPLETDVRVDIDSKGGDDV